MQKNCLTVAASILTIPVIVTAEEFGGIEFPQGAASFADAVVSYDPAYGGGNVPTHPNFINPAEALGAPDHPGGNDEPGSVSLGSGGRVVLEFTNNRLTGSDDATPDLHIFEVGSDVEDTFVEISADGANWAAVGKVFGSTSSVDIDAFDFTSADSFRFVRLTDDPDEGLTSGETVGADIDAVGAITTFSVQDEPTLAIEQVVEVSFQSALGSTYTIQESTDMEAWSDAVTEIQGTGEILRYCFELTIPRRYYRLTPPGE